jgi:hypothetical protein
MDCETEKVLGVVPIRSVTLNVWSGGPVQDSYGNKPLVDWNREPLFAELAILQSFQQLGWSGVWVDSFRKKYRMGLPELTAPVLLPNEQQELLNRIRGNPGWPSGCWDLVIWKGEETRFIELKNRGKDRLRQSQIDWLGKALNAGLRTEQFLIIEWTFEAARAAQ